MNNSNELLFQEFMSAQPNSTNNSSDFHMPFKNSTRSNLPLHPNAFIKNPILGGIWCLWKTKTFNNSMVVNNYYNITADSVTFN